MNNREGLERFLAALRQGSWEWKLYGAKIRADGPGYAGDACPLSVFHPDGPRPCSPNAAEAGARTFGLDRDDAYELMRAADKYDGGSNPALRQRLLEATRFQYSTST